MKTDYTGKRYGRLVVLGDGDDKISPNGTTARTFDCICDCGKKVNVRHTSVLGTTKSCGCLNHENLMNRNTTHGDCGTRLHRCWKSMKTRCRERGESCGYYNDWDDFSKFKKWALLNGYSDDKVLCRNGDVGDYEPSNARWDTQIKNIQEGNGKYYTITSPEGNIYNIHNLSQFCREYGLCSSGMGKVANSDAAHYKGWGCEHAK